jgi:hypothetical protein
VHYLFLGDCSDIAGSSMAMKAEAADFLIVEPESTMPI